MLKSGDSDEGRPFNMNTPLTVAIEGENLVIRIGLECLAFGAENCPDPFFWDEQGRRRVKIFDRAVWAKEMLRQLCHEEEDGTTPVDTLLDDMAMKAIEDGAQGVIVREDDESDAFE